MSAGFVVGFAAFACGFLLIFWTLGGAGALAKSRQLGALAAGFRGELGEAPRRRLRLGVFLLAVGAAALFATVGRGDALRRKRCREACASRGYASGAIRASTERHPTRPGSVAFVACACEGEGRPPLELPADDLGP